MEKFKNKNGSLLEMQSKYIEELKYLISARNIKYLENVLKIKNIKKYLSRIKSKKNINMEIKYFYNFIDPLKRASNEDKKFYKIEKIENGKFFYNRNSEYILVDSLSEYENLFNKTPEQDEIERIKSGLEIKDRGKSKNSCFVIDKENNFYIFPYRTENIQHTFITKGESVYVSGTINLEKGIIKEINNRSGHYRPELENIHDFYNFLLQNKINLKNTSMIFRNYKNENEKNLSEKLYSIFKEFSSIIIEYPPK